MVRLLHRRIKRVGVSPGTLEYLGPPRTEQPRITVINYGPDHFDERHPESVDEALALADRPGVTWINIDGLHDTELMERIGGRFHVHPLVLEDILNTGQRPKLEDYDGYLYLVLRMLSFRAEAERVDSEQLSLVLGPDCVLSFQEVPGDFFDPVRERLRSGKGRARKMAADYLAYALMDAVVDHYFVLLETFGEKIESLEEEIVENPTPELLHTTHDLRRQVIVLRRSVWPLREVVSGLERSESPLIRKGTRVFLRDLYDHTIQVVDAVESFRDILAGIQDLYLSSVSNRMNEVMKVLTIIATMFVPTTFLAGVYGMNFHYMPELSWKWGYPLFWLVVVTGFLGMLVYFRRRRWF